MIGSVVSTTITDRQAYKFAIISASLSSQGDRHCSAILTEQRLVMDARTDDAQSKWIT